MAHERKLLAAGIAGILAAASAPYLHDAWLDYRLRRAEARTALAIRLKEREIACLERLRASGLPEGMDVAAEIEACRRLSADPQAGN